METEIKKDQSILIYLEVKAVFLYEIIISCKYFHRAYSNIL